MHYFKSLKKVSIWISLFIMLFLMAACGTQEAEPAVEEAEPAAEEAAPAAEEAEPAAEEAAAEEAEPAAEEAAPVAEAVAEGSGLPIDLTGHSIKFSSEQPHTINTTFFKMTKLLEEAGADVEIIYHAGGTFGISTVLAGEVDVAENDTDELMLGIAQGADVKAFMTNTAHMDYVLITRNDIGAVTDLAGKNIGMSGPGGFDTLLGRVALEENGVDPTEANFVQIGGSGDRATALAAGQVDAATIFVDDWLELSQRTEDLQALVYMADIVPNITKGVYYARTEWLDSNPEMAVGIACAQLEANKWFHESQQEWIDAALADVEGATEEAVTETYDILSGIDMFPRDGGFDPAGIEALMEIMLETGDLEAPLDVDQTMDRSYLDEALALGCGGGGQMEAAAEPAAEEAMEAGLPIDLAGQAVKFSSEQPHTINTTFFKMTKLLEEAGADVEIIYHAGGTFGISTVLAGEVDVAENDTDELMLGIAQGAEVKAFMTNTAHMDYVLITRNDIGAVTDLAGKNIGMSGPGGFDTLLGRVTLEENGIDPTEANFVQIGGSGDRATALAAGQVDAATIFVDDWLELSQRTEDLQALVYMADVVPNITKGVYYARTEWLDSNPEMAVGIACAQLEANKWFHESQQEWIDAALADVEGATEEAVTETYDILSGIDMFPRDGGFDPAGIEALMEIMLETGDLEAPLDVDQTMDRSYLDEALALGCGQ